MKHTALLVIMCCQLLASDVTQNDKGEITGIGEVEISVGKVGVLKYDTIDDRTVDKEMRQAYTEYLHQDRYKRHAYKIFGKKTIGEFVLLVFTEDHVDDGGIDLVYSLKETKVIGWYMGGYRG